MKYDAHDHHAPKLSHSHIISLVDSSSQKKTEFIGFLVNHTNKVLLQKLVKGQLQHHHHQLYEEQGDRDDSQDLSAF